MIYLITGKRGAGKTHYARALAEELKANGRPVKILDGDTWRKDTSNKDFSDQGRVDNLMSAAGMAKTYEEQGYDVVMAFMAPRREWRDRMRRMWRLSRMIYIPGGTLWEGTTYEPPTDDELMTVSLFMEKEGK